MSNDIPYEFRQCSNFLYYTGCLESNAALLIDSGDAVRGIKPRQALFVPKRDAERERWDGPRTGVERAGEMFGFEEVGKTDMFGSKFRNLIRKSPSVIV
jgi:Xaa-Pro aminopeptidase